MLKYPSHILPKNKYEHLIDIDKLNRTQIIYVLRRSSKDFLDSFNVVGDTVILREDVIDKSEIPNMSLNLAGGKFKDNDLKYIPKINTRATEKWNGSEKIYLSEYLNCYKIADKFCPIYFDVSKIHKKEIPYQQGKTKDLRKLLKEMGEDPIEINDKYQFSAIIEVSHEPINLNYWHVELKIKDFKKHEISSTKSAWVKELCEQTLKNILAVNAYHEIITKPIPSSSYLKINSSTPT